MDTSLIVTARWLVVDADTIIDDGALFVEEGRVKAVGRAHDFCAPGRWGERRITKMCVDLLHPGFVNAHCHLELGFLAGRLKKRMTFDQWIVDLVAARRSVGKREIDAGIRAGVDRLVQTGTTCIGDITSDGRSTKILQQRKIRGVVFHEVLGVEPTMARERREDMERRFAATPATALLTHGVSPHAPYSTAPSLYRDAARFARKMKAPLTTHLCETPEETEFTRWGKGAFAIMLKGLGFSHQWLTTGLTPVNTLLKNGALKGALLAHMNHPNRGDLAAIAKAKGAVVLCPGSNLWFGRTISHPTPKLLKRGITVALGTDSRASNDDFDMGREMALAVRMFPKLAPSDVFRMATENGARGLGFPSDYGTLRPGAPFDGVALVITKRPVDPYRAIMSRSRKISDVWINGKTGYTKREI